MKKLLVVLAFLSIQFVSAQEAEVKKTILAFFEGFNSVNTDKVKAVCSDKMILQTVEVHTAENKYTTETAENFYKLLKDTGSKVKFEERIKEYKIQTDGHIAHVWAPYEFYINGEFSHKGVDSFELVKFKDGWKIVFLIDTRMP